jgi:hypothetical protein
MALKPSGFGAILLFAVAAIQGESRDPRRTT